MLPHLTGGAADVGTADGAVEGALVGVELGAEEGVTVGAELCIGVVGVPPPQ